MYKELGIKVGKGRKVNEKFNLMYYVDLARLADDLIKNWDKNTYYESNEGKIVQVAYGF